MSILPSQHIRAHCVPCPTRNAVPGLPPFQPLIEPFVERSVAHGMSYGLSGNGYDLRIRERLVIAPGEFRTASSIERIIMPNYLCATLKDKSTWLRRGLEQIGTSEIEAGWYGYVTFEFKNSGHYLLEIEAGSPIMQIRFETLVEATEQPYGSSGGKYQNQPPEPVPARMEAPANAG